MVEVLDRVLCSRLVGRDEQLFALEDALLAAHGGETRLVALGGEAGMGKTRLAGELAKRAQQLGWTVLWGACSASELPIPYLPVVEAIGNYLSGQDTAQVNESLGAARRDLAQLFPQLGDDEPVAPVGDPMQAKLRLFEAVLGLLGMAACDQGLLLILEDVHWADTATRELLDHLSRRLTSMRALLLLTYRSDELDRRHPLAPLLQSWRRSGSAELVALKPLDCGEVAEFISAILDGEQVDPEFGELMYTRSEGNPFVVEEMLKEAMDRADAEHSGDGWQQRSLQRLRIPDTVRDTILLRFARLDPAEAQVLQAAAVLGRTFDYRILVTASGSPEDTVHRALEVGVAQQLLDELADGRTSYRWRHALTQEAVSTEIVLPRRQVLHGRAADALIGAGAGPLVVAGHLLGASRFEEAVPACLKAAEEAEASLAFADALQLLEQALPHVHEGPDRFRMLCRMGALLWMDDKSVHATEVLVEGILGLEGQGDELEAARYRLVLGRCQWEQSRPDLALEEFERARRTLEGHAPSADLAMAYTRLAGLHQFDKDPRAFETATKAVEVARIAGAEFERVWAQSFLALAIFDAGETAKARSMLDDCFAEARARGFMMIAHNIAYNDTWTRLHTMSAGVTERLDVLASEPGPAVMTNMIETSRSWTLRARGELAPALAAIERQTTVRSVSDKVRWRARVERAEVLLELGRVTEAQAILPETSERAELQDLVYDAAPQIRLRLETGRIDEAVQVAREVASHAARLAPYDDALGVAVEALVKVGLLDEAQAGVNAVRSLGLDIGEEFLDEAQGRIMLARGEVATAKSILETVAGTAAVRGFRLVEWRTRALVAEALALLGRPHDAEVELKLVLVAADAAGAVLIADSARTIAERHGLSLPHSAPVTSAKPDITLAGERLVTSMFADVRGFTELTATTPPAEMADRITTLYRWAAAEVTRHHGVVNKFAGDAVMATFNTTSTRIDHPREALEAALALSGKAALLDLGVGIGISVGPAVVGPKTADADIVVLGQATNLAARLQTAAKAGEIVLSEEAHRRVAAWLKERGLEATQEPLQLKGFDGPQHAWRLCVGAKIPVGS
jgi:class 3 adenylate cyclase/tetratricopeptide (TPR) repeat protein